MTEVERSGLGIVVSDIPAIIAAVSAFSIALSLSREIGFFMYADLTFVTIYSISDIISSSLPVVPFALIALIFGVSSDRSINYKNTPSVLKPIFNVVRAVGGGTSWKAVKITYWILSIAIMWTEFKVLGLTMIFFGIYTMLTMVVIRKDWNNKFENYFLLHLSAAMIASGFVIGVLEFNLKNSEKITQYEVTFSDNSKEIVKIYRVLSRYLIMSGQDGRISAVDVSNVKRFTKISNDLLTQTVDLHMVYRRFERRYLLTDRKPDRRDE